MAWKNYTEWKKAVDAEVVKLSGLSCDDLADFMYRDAFDDGELPEDVVIQVLEAEGYPIQ